MIPKGYALLNNLNEIELKRRNISKFQEGVSPIDKKIRHILIQGI